MLATQVDLLRKFPPENQTPKIPGYTYATKASPRRPGWTNKKHHRFRQKQHVKNGYSSVGKYKPGRKIVRMENFDPEIILQFPVEEQLIILRYLSLKAKHDKTQNDYRNAGKHKLGRKIVKMENFDPEIILQFPVEEHLTILRYLSLKAKHDKMQKEHKEQLRKARERDRKRRWREKHPEHCREYQRKWRADNKEYYKAWQAAYRKKKR